MGGACTTPQEVEYEVVLHTYNACTGPAQAFLGLLGGGGAYVIGSEMKLHLQALAPRCVAIPVPALPAPGRKAHRRRP